ncbi:MAG: lamin tail domain-containing protein [Chloroflexi bacterium]|nr:lamin tail domain-containing protein [Chloroflexota bacterium]
MRQFVLLTTLTLFFIFIALALAAPFPPTADAQGCPTCPPREPPPRPIPDPKDPRPANPDNPPGTSSSLPTPLRVPIPTQTRPTPAPTQEPSASGMPEVPPSASGAPEIPPPAIVMPPPSPAPTVAPAVAAKFSTAIVLNEYVAFARNRDWNNDGAKNSGDEWIELYNSGDSPVDLSGWQIAHTANGGGAFIIPNGATIAPRGYLVFFRAQTGLALADQNDVIQLIYPNGAMADLTNHAALKENQVYARSVDGAGTWVPECTATPNVANCPIVAAGNFFREHIASPARFNLNLAVLVTNILLALILALAMGFFGNLLNAALETHEERVARWFAPARAAWQNVARIGARFDAVMRALRLTWFGFALKLALVLMLYGIVFAYLDPGFDIASEQGWLLILALALSAGVIGIIDDLAQFIVLRWRGSRSVIRIHGGNFLIAIVSALFSRLSGLTPGLLIGSPAGIEEVDDPTFEIPSHLLALGAIGGAAIVAWLITPFTDPNVWVHTALLLIFAMGVQTVFFEMLPIKYLHGRGIFEFNRWVWLGIFALTATIFFQTMLNPDGDFIRAFEQSNMVILALIVIAFCVGTTALWFYLQRAEKIAASG